jgi:hypothetical protein
LTLSDAAWLAGLPPAELLAECLLRCRLYLSGGRTDEQFRAMRWVWFECEAKGLAAEFESAWEQALAEDAETRREQWRSHLELLERIPRKS